MAKHAPQLAAAGALWRARERKTTSSSLHLDAYTEGPMTHGIILCEARTVVATCCALECV